jgi:hypothetical protein
MTAYAVTSASVGSTLETNGTLGEIICRATPAPGMPPATEQANRYFTLADGGAGRTLISLDPFTAALCVFPSGRVVPVRGPSGPISFASLEVVACPPGAAFTVYTLTAGPGP